MFCTRIYQKKKYQHYHLRQRPHNKALIPKTTYLSNGEYKLIMRILYCYSLTAGLVCFTKITTCSISVMSHCVLILLFSSPRKRGIMESPALVCLFVTTTTK